MIQVTIRILKTLLKTVSFYRVVRIKNMSDLEHTVDVLHKLKNQLMVGAS